MPWSGSNKLVHAKFTMTMPQSGSHKPSIASCMVPHHASCCNGWRTTIQLLWGSSFNTHETARLDVVQQPSVRDLSLDLLLLGQLLTQVCLFVVQVIRVLHNKTLAKAAHDIKRLKILSDISQFDSQILKLTTYVFLWIHWNACLQYGSCVAQPDSR